MPNAASQRGAFAAEKMVAKGMGFGVVVMDWAFVFMETLLEVVSIVFHPMTSRNVLMPWLA